MIKDLFTVLKKELNSICLNAATHIPGIGYLIDIGNTLVQTYNSISDQIFLKKYLRVLNCVEEKTSLEEQVKIVKRLHAIAEDEDKFLQFLIWIEENDDVKKIQYFSNLLCSAILFDMEEELLYLLIKIVDSCTSYQLDYIKAFNFDKKNPMEGNMSYLFYKGIFTQAENDNSSKEILYCLSDLGKGLKVHCTNYGEENLPDRPKAIKDIGQQDVFGSAPTTLIASLFEN